MNRTASSAQELVDQYGGRAVAFADIKEIFGQVDVCICATDAPHYILDFETVKSVTAAKAQPILMIDISMPRNIDPQVNELQYVKLFHIDDLAQIVDGNMLRRKQAVPVVRQIIERKCEEFYVKITKNRTHQALLGG